MIKSSIDNAVIIVYNRIKSLYDEMTVMRSGSLNTLNSHLSRRSCERQQSILRPGNERTDKMKKKYALTSIMTAAVLLMPSCSGNAGRNSTSAGSINTESVQTAVSATNINELDNETDWKDMADIEEIDSANEEGTGKLYVAGQKAGEVKALCYYDLASSQSELAELLALRYGGTITTEICSSGSAYFDKLGVLIASGDSPDIVRYDWMAHPTGTSKNMFTCLDDWLDIDSPLWSGEKEVIDSFNYLGRHYYFPSDVSTNFAVIYNTRSLEEAGLPNPADLYFDNNWTWDTFEDMMSKWVNIGPDYTGFTGGSWSAMMFANTTGVKIIDMTGTDIVNNMKNPDVQRAMDRLSEMKKLGYIGDGFVDPAEAFVDGKLLFLGMGLTWGFESAQGSFFQKGLDGDFEVVPFPRDPNADRYYMSADTYGFLVPTGAHNIQGAVDWILCGRLYATDPDIVAADRAKRMDTSPVYYAKCPECKYNFEAEGQDDLDTCPNCGAARKRKFKPVYSERVMRVCDDMTDPEKFGFIFDNSLGFNDDFSLILTGGEESLYDGPIYYGSSYTQLREINYNLIESYLDEYRAAIKKAEEEKR